MSIPLNVNGAVFAYPENFDEAWGANATGWAQAVTVGMLQRAGGSFPLLANVNFGPTFGLLSDHFQTRASNPASTGLLRLTNTDSIAWRNTAHSGDLLLAINGFDQLTFNGAIISTSAAAVTGIIGTANQVLANGTSGSLQTGNITLTTPQDIAPASSPAFAGLTLTGLLSSVDIEPTTADTSVLGTVSKPWLSMATDEIFLHKSGFGQLDIKPNAAQTTYSLIMPASQGTASSFLQNDGSGNLSWSNTLTGATISSSSLGTNLAAGGHKITGLAAPTTSGDALAYGNGFDVGSNKITGLANGTSATDAAAFGQIPSTTSLTLAGLTPALGTITSADSLLSAFGKVVNARVVQVILGTSTTAFSTGSGTFVATNLSATITPQNAGNHIIVLACGGGGQGTAGVAYYTLFRDGLNQFGGNGQCHVSTGSGTGGGAPAVIMYMVLAGSTSATTFEVAARAVGGTAIFGDGVELQAMILIEVGA